MKIVQTVSMPAASHSAFIHLTNSLSGYVSLSERVLQLILAVYFSLILDQQHLIDSILYPFLYCPLVS